jgi:hypothetical protein
MQRPMQGATKRHTTQLPAYLGAADAPATANIPLGAMMPAAALAMRSFQQLAIRSQT